MYEKSLQERYKSTNIFTLRCEIVDKPGKLSSLIAVIAEVNAQLDKIESVGVDSINKFRDITIYCQKSDDIEIIIPKINAIEGLRVIDVVDEVLESHRRGTIETKSRMAIKSLTDLRKVYTPGVASVCKKIVDDPSVAWDLTGICDRVAIVSDGTAVLGLGDVGASAALPVMEGKAAIFAEFVGISGVPIVLDTKVPDEIVNHISLMAHTFGAIQLEDIAAPACFEIEEKLREKLNIPVFHDDQHATATVVLAALINALRQVNKEASESRAIIIGAGAAGYAITKILLEFGLKDIVVYDADGAIYKGRKDMNPYLEKLAYVTNKDGITGSLEEGFKERDIFIGVARANLVSKEMIRSMAEDAIVFPLSNPVGEISVEDASAAGAKVTADGRTINNALAFPGIFRGALDARAKEITAKMQLAASNTLAELATDGNLLPDMLDAKVHLSVSKAVQAAATEG